MGHLGHAPRPRHAPRQGHGLRPSATSRSLDGRAQASPLCLLPLVHQRQVSRVLAATLNNLTDSPLTTNSQGERADNVLAGEDKAAHLEQIRKDIREFKAANGLDKVIVLWTANTERYAEIIPGVNDTKENLLQAVKDSHAEVAPSTIFAIASILEGSPFINGAPQNTFVPGCIELAEHHKAFIAGDDFKSGQTKVKSVLAEFLVNAGIKPLSIACEFCSLRYSRAPLTAVSPTAYNHLGNNDGHNLSAPAQFRSKEISKSSVVDDMVEVSLTELLSLSASC